MFGLTPWKNREAVNQGALAPIREHPLRVFRDEFDSLFDSFFGSWPPAFQADRQGLQRFWGLDLEDTGTEVVVRADAPGFETEDFDIQVSGNQLTIRAEKKQEDKDETNGFSYSERRLHRSVTLPAGADPDKVEARYRNGVLEVHLPKSPEAQGKRITVKS